MKKLFKSISLLLALVLVLSAVPTTNVEAASKVKLNKTTVSLNEGKTTTLKVKGTAEKIKWSSSNKKVATVNQKGKVTAKKKGTATITAKVSGKKYKCKVTVKAKGEFPYEIYKVYDDGGINVYFYYTVETMSTSINGRYHKTKTKCTNILWKRYPNADSKDDPYKYVGTYNGVKYYKSYTTKIYDANGKVIVKAKK